MSDIIHGRNLIVKVDGTAIAAAKSCNIIESCETIQVSTPTSSQWNKYIAGRQGWSVTVNYLVVDPDGDLDLVGQEVELTFEKTGTQPAGASSIRAGMAICTKCEIQATLGNLAQGSFSFQGSGELSNPLE